MVDNNDSPYDFAPGQEPPKRAVPVKSAACDAEPPKSPVAGAALVPGGATDRTDAALPRQECPYCGHEFVGKSRARCPECATPMDIGTRDYLQFAASMWVRKLGLGAYILCMGVLAHVAGIIFHLDQLMTDGGPPRRAKGIAHIVGALLMLVGTFLATAREPDAAQKSTVKRAVLFLTALVALALWLVLGLAALAVVPEIKGPVIVQLVAWALTSQLPLAIVLGFHLGGLAMRLPDDRVAFHSKLSGWLIAGDCAALTLLWLMQLVTKDDLEFFPIAFPILAIIFLTAGWAAITLLRLGLNFGAAAKAGADIIVRRQQNIAARNKPRPGSATQAAGGS